ncbi:MAG: winged helix-turn-helix domain-containing protein [Candidatus Eiseniibacteriota bacterium]
MKYRSRSDIIALILEAANGGTTKTKIMYKSYISFAQLRDYLAMLTEQGLVGYDEIGHIFKTTSKGLQVLQLQNQINEEFDALDDDRKRRLVVGV